MLNLHPTATPEYWERLAQRERLFASSFESGHTAVEIQQHLQNAVEYGKQAEKVREIPNLIARLKDLLLIVERVPDEEWEVAREMAVADGCMKCEFPLHDIVIALQKMGEL